MLDKITFVLVHFLDYKTCDFDVPVDSGRFSIHGNSKYHTTRLQGGERILQRYENDPSSLIIINDLTLLFKIQSVSTPSHWYYVSLQSNYCDCPDLTSDCKHLYAIRLIIEKHFPHLISIIPIVDKARTMDIEETSIEHAECNPTAMENNVASSNCSVSNHEVMVCVDEVRDILSKIEAQLEQSDSSQKIAYMNKLNSCRDILVKTLAPKEIDMPRRGSIRQIQANVTQTRLGHGKKLEVSNPSKDHIVCGSSQPTKHASVTGVLRRKHQRGRYRVRFYENPRVWCPHCCTKTFMVDPKVTMICTTCHALLPLTARKAPIGVEEYLLNKNVRICDIPTNISCKISACQYRESPDDERFFTLVKEDGELLCNVLASEWRLVLL